MLIMAIILAVITVAYLFINKNNHQAIPPSPIEIDLNNEDAAGTTTDSFVIEETSLLDPNTTVSKDNTMPTPSSPPTTDLTKTTNCLPEQQNADACIEIYQPVCATVNIQCITTPCNPIQQTFSNSCKACSNSLVESYTMGECEVE